MCSGAYSPLTPALALLRSQGLSTFQQVQEFRKKPPTDISGSESPEYKLIVQANNYAVEIDNDILMVHKVCP